MNASEDRLPLEKRQAVGSLSFVLSTLCLVLAVEIEAAKGKSTKNKVQSSRPKSKVNYAVAADRYCSQF
jgi:hypothetical protein